jgi:hypothetical protein
MPRWLTKAEDLDAFARNRVMLVLSVLSGEKPVTEAIAEARMSRPAYYKLEMRALRAMLAALNPLAPSVEYRQGELARTQAKVRVLEAKVKGLVQEKRRAERLLLLTRKSLRLSGRSRRKGARLIPTPWWRLPGSPTKAELSAGSMPTSDGGTGR